MTEQLWKMVNNAKTIKDVLKCEHAILAAGNNISGDEYDKLMRALLSCQALSGSRQ
jgi:hypothetical protein